MMLRIALAGALMLASVGAYAQFNKCGRGFCPGGINGPGVTTPGGSIPVAPCVPGGPTGQMDFSLCSNIAITAAAMP